MKLSVIVPIYNIAKYISKCLDSILKQDFEDMEIICINDGSKDNSLDVLNKYKKLGVKIIDKENEGSGAARNIGLEKAQGEYVLFIDGDDWLRDNSIKKLIKKADELKTDMLIFGGLSYHNGKGRLGGYSITKFPKKYFRGVYSAKDLKSDIFKFPTTTWTKLYRRDFLLKNNIKFQNIRAGQDQLPNFHAFITAERIAVLPENLYCYRKNRLGSTTSVNKKKNFSPIYVFYGAENLLKELGKIDEYKYIFVNKYFSKATSWLGKFDEELKPDYYKEYLKLLEHIKSEYPFGWWKNFNPDIKDGYWKLKFKQGLAKISTFR